MKTKWRSSAFITHHADVLTWCPGCYASIDATGCMTASVRPQPGDFTICGYCAAVLRFTAQMDLEGASLMDIPEADRMPFAQLVMAIKQYPLARHGDTFTKQ